MISGLLVRVDYALNTNKFAKSCINKAKPKLKCNGKCQMIKKIKDQEKKEEENNQKNKENNLLVLSSKSFFYLLEKVTFSSFSKAKFYNISSPLSDISYSFFHPPKV
ncbi:MAG: hypothetical protein HOO89_02370 [Ferruginibacter sp.]|nr:hypothetical protein [Ferruginibacter sp.]